MILLRLAFFSLKNRRFTTLLTIASIALSVSLLLGVEKIRLGARDSFNNTISQTDLIVGPRTGSIQLLLYAVFHPAGPSRSSTWFWVPRWPKSLATSFPRRLPSRTEFRMAGSNMRIALSAWLAC